MFKCLDKNGRELHIDDVVVREDDGVVCLVNNLISETEVLTIPTGRAETHVPQVTHPVNCVWKESLLQRIADIKNDQFYKQILNDAKTWLPVEKTPRKRKVKEQPEESEIEIEA